MFSVRLDFLAADGHLHLADQQIVDLHCSVQDRRPVPASRPHTVYLGRHCLVRDDHHVPLHGNPLQVGQCQIGLHLDLAGELKVA